MKKLPHLLFLGLAFGAASVMSGQTSSATPRSGKREPGGPGGPAREVSSPIVRVLDADRDREISAAELANAAASLRTLDADADGAVSAAELRPARRERPADAPTPPAGSPRRGGPPRSRPADPIMLALDANSDGSLAESEIANAAASLAALDANKDGKLTRDELRPLPPAE